MKLRLLLLALAASAILACGQVARLIEPSPQQLLEKANENLKAAKTTHFDGTGSISVKGGMSIAFDFTMRGDAEIPDKSRMTVEMALFGQSLNSDVITVGGKSYTKDSNAVGWKEGSGSNSSAPTSMLDPIGQMDPTTLISVTEVDRPDVDGKPTRHLAYTIDPQKLLEQMKKATTTQIKALNPVGKGEVWIRVDNNQIVRQLVKLSFDMEGDLGLPMPSGASPAKASMEVTFDLKFSRIGDPVTPAITAPPLKR